MQRRVLVRARGLAAFRQAVVARALAGDPLAARRRVVVVPTRASGELLRQTIEHTAFASGRTSVILPDFVTRDEWMTRLSGAVGADRPLLSRLEREVILERAARDATRLHTRGIPPFELRPGLVGAMLDFYDELKRRQRDVRRFAGTLFTELGGAGGAADRGSESLLRQTIFLGYAYLAYERAVRASGRLDEHGVRARLITTQPALPFDHVVVAVADHPSDPRGLWPADFDLAGRLTSLARIDVVVTDETHDAGFRERLEQELPEIEEERAPDVPRAPFVVQPATGSDLPVFICRDREEELRAVARTVRAEAHAAGGTLAPTIAIVFQRPLPYLYLAQQVLIDARVPYQAFDALPLASEPYAALLDLVLDVARTSGTRESVVALLRSTLLACAVDGRPIDRRDVAMLDGVLAERRATGAGSTYEREVDAFFRDATVRQGLSEPRARRAARAAADVSAALGPFLTADSASLQVRAISAFLRVYERMPVEHDSRTDRYRAARAAVLSVLDELAAAFQAHDDRRRAPDLLVAIMHHAIESRTFAPRRGQTGVHLVDAVAARFGEFDRVFLVGLTETDWPERLRRSIFYSTGLLKILGWPQEPDQMRAEQAAFRDLLALARDTTRVSAFQLEGDAVVALSPMTEALRGLPVVSPPVTGEILLPDDVMARGSMPDGLDAEPSAWLAGRVARPPLSGAAYSGVVDPQAPAAYRVSRVDRYVACPFKYFAESVLRLREERDEMSGLTPLERGTLLHALFEEFYRRWQQDGRHAITAATLPEAVAVFSEIAESALARLAEPDRTLERARLLGSIVGPGVAERVFELEVDSDAPVRARLLEHELKGSFTFPRLGGLDARTIEVSGKADRIDILEDGSLCVVDYKLGRMPDLKSSVQIAVYAHCARQSLEAADGRPHPVSGAMYLAFGEQRRLDGSIAARAATVTESVEVRAGEFADAVAGIEAGHFPPQPRKPGDCQWCGYAGVCRKEYRVEDDETADAV